MDSLAGPSAVAAGVVAIVSGIFLVAFFATGREILGRANDATAALMAVLLIPAAFAVGDRFTDSGVFMVVVMAVGIAALIETAVASLLTALGRLSPRQLMVWQGGGFAVLFAWVLGVSVGTLWLGRLPSGLGYLGFAVVAGLVVTLLSVGRLARRLGGWDKLAEMQRLPVVATIGMLVAFFGLPAWCIWLGLALADAAPAG